MSATRDAVLVIDDDPDFREAIRLLLEDMGTFVLDAADGASALELLDREAARVHLVLLDYWMPGMTALECVRSLRARLGTDVEIVLVTAASKPRERAIELGIKRYVSKPFDLEQLERLVARSRGA